MNNNKIRFLATGDIHSKKKFIDMIEKYGKLDDIDFVIFTGDLSEKKDDFSKLLGIFKGKQIFMVPGNHETKRGIKNLEEHYNVHLVGNAPILVNDDLALFGSNYVPIGPYGETEEEILLNMVENYESIKDTKFKIMLSHLPPEGTKMERMTPFFPFIGGSVATRAFLEEFKPDYALVGHIHEGAGLEEILNKTKVVNVAETFKIFEFDVEKKELKML
ncbi:MAG: metallophosphoesterase [Candidatus Woesearchaeota archaeon]|jgi:Icc-related predicted phosphoesterase|nr:metallophosphoesterase [Candidatus Woesearchaeota archaeon]